MHRQCGSMCSRFLHVDGSDASRTSPMHRRWGAGLWPRALPEAIPTLSWGAKLPRVAAEGGAGVMRPSRTTRG
eukprot:6649883-Pyramimonas_sp.AAC.1